LSQRRRLSFFRWADSLGRIHFDKISQRCYTPIPQELIAGGMEAGSGGENSTIKGESYTMKRFLKLQISVLRLGLLAMLSAATLVLAQDRQSPVDFNAQDVDQVHHLPKVKVDMSNHVTLSVVNTWNPADTSVNGGPVPKDFCTVRANVPPGTGSVTVNGRTFNLTQFHFHTPAEHTVDELHAPMEAHFVFVDSMKNYGEPDSVLVVGAWIVEGRANTEFAKIFSNLPAPNTTITVSNFNVASVFPDMKGTFRYPGSLTTPTFIAGYTPSLAQQIDTDIFPEITLWIVVDDPIVLSEDQINAFRALFPEAVGNARETQPLDGRRVLHGK
jgi:carbonic anhydrase